MGRKKPQKDREWFERQVAEMGEALKRLPADRQDALNTLDDGRIDGRTTSENKNTSIAKGNGLPCAARGARQRTASRPHSPDGKSSR